MTEPRGDPPDDDGRAARSESGRRRRLVAILHADIAGYSRHMQRDEEGTWRRAVAIHGLAEREAASRGGRLVGTAGDAVLLEFPSVTGAIDAALAMQEATAAASEGLPAEERIELRIGINLGDVIDHQGDLYGDGVNVAERVQSLADPGGIAVSGPVRDQLRHRKRLRFQDRGSHRVKNIAEPVRIFAVARGDGRIVRPRRHLSLALAALVVLLVAVGAALWQAGLVPLGGEADPLSGKPTVAVLPFEDRSPGDTDAWFADGITEDVIADLGRFSSLHVLSWSAVAPYRGQSVSPEALSRVLGVRYIVSGSVARGEDRLTLRVQLTDAATGTLLWSERLSERVEDVFALQQKVARRVVGALAVKVTGVELDRALDKPTDSLDAYEAVLKGRALLRTRTRPANFEARSVLERAVELDPGYAAARVALGWTHLFDYIYGWSVRRDRSRETARSLAEEALSHDPNNADAHALLAYLLRFEDQPVVAERHIDLALDLNPNDAQSHAIKGMLRLMQGDLEAARETLELAIRLDPSPVESWFFQLGEAYYLLGRYQDTVAVIERFRSTIGEDPAPYAILAAAYARLGEEAEAAAAAEDVRRLSPFFDTESFAAFFAPEGHETDLLEGMRAAGL